MDESMEKRLVMVHTVSPLVEVFNRLGAILLPGVKLFHILDEPLLEQVRLLAGLQLEQITRLQAHIDAAQSIHASAVLVTCSTLSPALDQVHASFPHQDRPGHARAGRSAWSTHRHLATNRLRSNQPARHYWQMKRQDKGITRRRCTLEDMLSAFELSAVPIITISLS
jgi:hypothetical protein